MSETPIVLVVEDDRELNDLQREFLSLFGLRSVPAYTGAEALDVAAGRMPDAVLLDVMLPELDGFECCRRLRELAGPDLPIVMLTALDGEDCRRRGAEAGASDYITKPFNPDEVVEKLLAMMGDGSPK